MEVFSSGSPPLWRQFQLAAAALADVRAGRSATPTLSLVERQIRPGVQALLYQALRNLGRGEALRRSLVPRPPPVAVDALLCLALSIGWNEADAPYEPFTWVNQAVEAAKRSSAMRPHAGLINACLRRFLRERTELMKATNSDLVARWNHPRWWIEQLRHDHPTSWETILQANDRAAPLCLRVNTLKTTVLESMEALAAVQIEARRVGQFGLELARARPVQQLPGFEAGYFSVQDAAAQLAAPLLLDGLLDDQRDRVRVLDACAAPGGKTAHLLEYAAGRATVTALEVDEGRSHRVTETLHRLGLHAQVCVADAAQPAQWWDGQKYDAVLLDAPCTASGVVRRHPDVRWLRREQDVHHLANQQAALLKALWPLVKVGGRLLYCTCSVFSLEGSKQIDAFLAHNSEAKLLSSPGHLLPQIKGNGRTLQENDLGEHDGFFYALLEKRPR